MSVAVQNRIFEETFPELDDVTLEYRAARPGGAFSDDRPLPTTKISLRNRGPIMHCLNPACKDGGLDVTATVREMLAEGVSEWEGRVICTGVELEEAKAWEECKRYNWAWDLKVTLVR